MSLEDKLIALRDRYGTRRVTAVTLVLLVGIASIAVRLLIEYEFDTTALLYISIPYAISLVLAFVLPRKKNDTWWRGYADHSLSALIVFLASSIVLFEGFICVLFFLPIYFLVVSLAFAVQWIIVSRKRRRGKTVVSILPALILLSSLEGTTDSLSVSRDNQVIVTKTVNMSAEQILENIATPFDLRKERHWMLALFPMPHTIEAGSLNPGDVHYVHTRYHRWFVTNTHDGELHLQIVDVQPDRVRTRILHDSTFFSSYLTILGTEITLNKISAGETMIALRIDYRRKLDPAWYFHPLQEFGVARMGEFLIDEVMIRE